MKVVVTKHPILTTWLCGWIDLFAAMVTILGGGYLYPMWSVEFLMWFNRLRPRR